MKMVESLKLGIPLVVVAAAIFAAGSGLGFGVGLVHREAAAHKAAVAAAKAKAGPAAAIVSSWSVSAPPSGADNKLAKKAAATSAAAGARAAKTAGLVNTYCALPASERTNGEGPSCGGLGQLAASSQGISVGAYYAASAAICATGGDCSATESMVKDTCRLAAKGSACVADGLAATKAAAGTEDFNGAVSLLCASGDADYCDRGGL